jgi:hypothetical protein
MIEKDRRGSSFSLRKPQPCEQKLILLLVTDVFRHQTNQGCGVGLGVGTNFRWSRSRKEF